MKIAIYKDTFANNRGADIVVKNLAFGLEERGHKVTLFNKTEFAADSAAVPYRSCLSVPALDKTLAAQSHH